METQPTSAPEVNSTGTSVPSNQQPLPMPPATPSDGRKRMWILIGVAAVVLVGIVAALFGGDLFKGSFLTGNQKLAITIDSVEKDAQGRTVLAYSFKNTDKEFSAGQLEIRGYTDANGSQPFFTRPLNVRSPFRMNQSVTMKTTFDASVIGEYKSLVLKVYVDGVEASSVTNQVISGGSASAPTPAPTTGGAAGQAVQSPSLTDEEKATLEERARLEVEAKAKADAAAASQTAPTTDVPTGETDVQRTSTTDEQPVPEPTAEDKAAADRALLEERARLEAEAAARATEASQDAPTPPADEPTAEVQPAPEPPRE